jgi:hypothetical protein
LGWHSSVISGDDAYPLGVRGRDEVTEVALDAAEVIEGLLRRRLENDG